MKLQRSLAVMVVLLLACTGLFAQSSTTGALSGTVTTGGNGLPGATITVTSPNLQGSRTAVTDANGNYSIAGLPPGDYTVKAELSGLQTVSQNVRVGVSSTARADADLKVTAVADAITVTASAPAVLETTEVQANYDKKLVDSLPLARTVTGIALLAPGTTSNGPRGAMQISGSFANDNLINVDGSNVQENLRGQARPLFIEDAIQETTVLTAGISAEYGRFTGGVVNAITKSGGNEFTGSFRDQLTNPKWTAISKFGKANPGTEILPNKIDNAYEATLGGRIIRDRLWFFTAGRYAKTTASGGSFRAGGSEFFSTTKNQRLEAKLTGQVTPRNSLQVTFLNSPLVATNNNQLGVYEQSGLDPSIAQKEDFKSAHYNGVITNNLLIEGNWSKRAFTFVGFGGDNPDIYAGTPLLQTIGGQGVANAPYFCGICDREKRDNRLFTGKASYFLGTKSFGTHNLVGGVEDFKEFRLSNNFQSATNLVVELDGAPAVRQPNGTVIFTVTPGVDYISYYPIEIPSIGSNLKTESAFVNDKWDLNSHLSFNVGGRFDKNNSKDSFGNKTSKDSSFSPRLGVIYDVTGNGRLRLNATYGKYVGRLAETVQGAGSPAGNPSGYYYYYQGPAFSGTSAQVVRRLIDDFLAKGGTNRQKNKPDISVVGGFSQRLASDNLKAPDMREFTVGAGLQIGQNGFVRADYIDRNWDNYYVAITNTGTGTVTGPLGDKADLTLISNTNLLDRTYKGVQLQGQYRLFSRLNLGANYTYSKLRGNAEGEGTAGGPRAEGAYIFQYPELQGFVQNSPSGFLSGDQRHKVRAYADLDLPIGPVGTLNFSVLQRYDSGTPFSLAASIPAVRNPATGTSALSYVSAPSNVTYFFGSRGSERWDNVSRTDVAVTYSLPISRAGFYVKGEVFNAFNRQAQIAGTTTVRVRSNTNGTTLALCPQGTGATAAQVAAGVKGTTPGRCDAFNPFTATPIAGQNFALPTGLTGTTRFRAARSKSDYQTPRTYQVAVGVRF